MSIDKNCVSLLNLALLIDQLKENKNEIWE